MGRKSAVSILSSALRLIQVGASIAIIVLVSAKLFKANLDTSEVISPRFSTKCLLDTGTSSFLPGAKFCVGLIVFAIASLLFSSVMSCAKVIFSCFTANVCGLSNIITVVTDVILAVLWGIAFVLTLRRGNAANDAGYPRRDYREGVIASAGIATISYALDSIVSLCGVGA